MGGNGCHRKYWAAMSRANEKKLRVWNSRCDLSLPVCVSIAPFGTYVSERNESALSLLC